MTADNAAVPFDELGVSHDVVNALAARGIERSFPIQASTIEAALDGRDICGKAPTGSGKTLAFGVPVVDLVTKGSPWRPSALILSPTRELATQIKDELEPLAKARSRRILTVFGGTNIERDIRRLEEGVDILVACPGRLEDLISRRCCELRDAALVVVDEADRMADMGFLPAVKRILDQTPGDRHTLLFSATLDGDVDTLISRYQNDPLTVEVEGQTEEMGDVEHSWYLIPPDARIDSAVAVLRGYWSSIVFCRTRRGCDRVAKMLSKRGLAAVAIHGDRSQNQRERALRSFTNGEAQVLVATDVAARGIHVDNVSLVMHYDPAGTDKDYIHRSGRTGRAGADGRVISMVVEDKKKIARQLQKDLGMKPGFDTLDLEALPGPLDRPAPKPKKPESKQRQDRGRSGDGGRGRTDGGRGAGGSNRGRTGGGRGGNRSGGGRSRNDRDSDRRDRTGGGRGHSSDGRGRNDRDDDRRRGGGDQRRRRSKSTTGGARSGRDNDWYPDNYDKHNQPGGKGGARRRTSGDRDRDERSDDRPTGGSNTTQRKSRKSKGRHADRAGAKNKGRPRGRSGSGSKRGTGGKGGKGGGGARRSGSGRPSGQRSGNQRRGNNRSR